MFSRTISAHCGRRNIDCHSGKRKAVCSLIALVVFLVILSGCTDNNKVLYSYPDNIKANAVDDGLIVGNKRFSMLWDSKIKTVLITDNETQKIWSSFPYEAYSEELTDGLGKVSMESPIIIEYIESESNSIKTLSASVGALKNGHVSSLKIDDGLRVIYYFDKVEIAVTVDYILREDSFAIQIPTQEICENKNKLYKISVAPFMASVKNNTENGYLLVPSGSGALMYVDSGIRKPREFEGQIFGDDMAISKETNAELPQTIKLPVFGVNDGKNALLGIVENGEEAAGIFAQAGSEDLMYSSIYPYFQLRGRDQIKISYVGKNEVSSQKYSDDMLNQELLSIGYYPLASNKANYAGMASKYRDYLLKEKQLQKKSSENTVALNILGGAVAKEFLLGIPYDKTIAVTTYQQAGEIINNFIDTTGVTPIVNLSGFDKTGLDFGAVGSGVKAYKVFGGKEPLYNLSEMCIKNKIPICIETNLFKLSKSSYGFSKSFDIAKTASNISAKQSFYSVALNNRDDEYYDYYLLSRDKLIASSENYVESLKKYEFSYAGLGDLSNQIYSDYSNRNYYQKCDFSNQVSEISDTMRKEDYKIISKNANSFAAVASDYILNAPTCSAESFSFDKTIPFYQIVFKGYIPLSGTAINSSDDPESEYLLSVMTGSALYYNLIYKYDIKLLKSPYNVLAQSVYSDNISKIKMQIEKSNDFLNKVVNAEIVDFQEILHDVYKTKFSTGDEIIVNISAKDVTIGSTVINAKDFVYGKEVGEIT